MESNPIIKLNLCGRIFEVEKNILMGSDLFKTMLADCPTDDSVIRISRSAHIFEHVLAYLIDSSYPYPREYANELQYYLISTSDIKFYDRLHELQQKIKSLESDIAELKSNLRTDEIVCCYDYCDKHVFGLGFVACKAHMNMCSYRIKSQYQGYLCDAYCEYNEKYCSDHQYD